MKARVKATGEIIEVSYHGLGVYADMNKWDEEYNFDEIVILEGGDPDYWTRIEHQAAIAAMQGFLAGRMEDTYNRVAEFSINQARALVKKMKEERK